jgi:hypothetical protein
VIVWIYDGQNLQVIQQGGPKKTRTKMAAVSSSLILTVASGSSIVVHDELTLNMKVHGIF